jgi:hypothetical protein
MKVRLVASVETLTYFMVYVLKKQNLCICVKQTDWQKLLGLDMMNVAVMHGAKHMEQRFFFWASIFCILAKAITKFRF